MCHTNSNLILVSPTNQNSWFHSYSSAQLRHLNTQVKQDSRLQVVLPQTVSKIRQLRIYKRPIRVTKQPSITKNHNQDNLLYVTVTNKIGKETTSTIKLATLNARSVKNKDEMIVYEFIKAKIDIGLLTETWLKDTLEDQAWINQSDLTQSNFILQQHNQQGSRKGGGKALPYHKNIMATLVESGHTCITEYALWKTILQNKPLHIMGIYHPPPSNDTTNTMFIDEIIEILEGRIGKYNNMVILGDLNMHVDDLTNANSYIIQ